MSTVRELASEFGVSPGLVIKALQSLAVYAEGPHSDVHPDHAQRFRDEFRPKIKKARPEPERVAILADVTDLPHLGTKFHLRKPLTPEGHVIRMAHAHVGSGRSRASADSMITASERFPILSSVPGLIHAIDLLGTRDGDFWRGTRVAGQHKFYPPPGPPAACGARIRAVLSDEFAPDVADACPACLETFESGKAKRNPPRERFERFDCHDFIRVQIEGVLHVEDCCLRDFHKGRHKSHSGATWGDGGKNFQASPPRENPGQERRA